jgi:2-succinyl-5-enolpyruvyl-6-hydroxy-3-cyclohexene-1-carboxylate synthase
MALRITGALSSYYDFPKLMISGDEHTNYTIVLMINQDGNGNGLVTTDSIWDSNKESFCSTGKWNIDEFRDYNEILTIKNK